MSSKTVTPRTQTADDYARAETAEKLALAGWALHIAKTYLFDQASDMARDFLAQTRAIADEDDEELADEADLKEQWERLIEEAVEQGLRECPNFAVKVRDKDGNEQPQIVNIKQKFTKGILINRVRLAITNLLQEKFQADVKTEVPGINIKKYGEHFKVSSLGVYCDCVGQNGLVFLPVQIFADGWQRIAKSRIEPLAWSYRLGEKRSAWRNHYEITDKDAHKRIISIPNESLVSSKGRPAIRQLASLGVRVMIDKDKMDAFVRFLRYEPLARIVRVPHTGWVKDSGHWLFIRPDGTLDGRAKKHLRYEFDGEQQSHGLQLSGSVEDWGQHVAAPLEGCSTVALALATFFATPLIHFSHEQPGGWHFHGPSAIGKTLCAALGQSLYGMPHGAGTGDTFGRSWQGTATGIEQFAALRSDVGLSLDEIGVGAVHPIKDAVYALSGGAEKLRGTSQAALKSSKGFRVLVLSTGEKSLAVFLGARDDAEGRKKRLVDVPAEVSPGTALETVPPHEIVAAGRRFYAAVKDYHGAVGRAWQQHLVTLGETEIRKQVEAYRNAWLSQPEVNAIEKEAHPQTRSVINRFALMAAALRMAIDAGLLPWQVKSADAGILACADRWAKQRGDLAVGGETLRAVDALRQTILDSLVDRFIELKPDEKGVLKATKELPPEDVDGYLKPDRILITPTAWSRLTGNATETVGYLLSKGWLTPGETGQPGKPKVERPGQGQKAQRFYVLRRDFLKEEVRAAAAEKAAPKGNHKVVIINHKAARLPLPRPPDNQNGVSLPGCKYIYAPGGQAGEYAPLATNPYRGCGHQCCYCYVPGAIHISRKEFDEGAVLRPDFIDGLRRDAKKYQLAGITEQVMITFTSDPYHPGDTTATRQTLEILIEHGMGICTLTKGGTRALRDIDLFRPNRDAFASTLTSLDDSFSLKWERNAPLPADRIKALQTFHERGIFTWVSIEPTLDVEASLAVVKATHPFVSLFKVGRANRLKEITRTTDWQDYTVRMIDLLNKIGARHYIKHDLQKFLPPGYPNPLRVQQHN